MNAMCLMSNKNQAEKEGRDGCRRPGIKQRNPTKYDCPAYGLPPLIKIGFQPLNDGCPIFR